MGRDEVSEADVDVVAADPAERRNARNFPRKSWLAGKKYFVFLFLLFLFSIFTTDAVSGLSLVNGSNLSTADLCLLPLTCSLYL